MNRRKFIAGIGVGITTVSAGCTSSNDSDKDESDNTESEASFPRHDKEKMRDNYYAARVEDEMQIKAHNLDARGIQEISDNKISLNCNVSVNPVDDYKIHLHYNAVDPSANGTWNKQKKFNPLKEPKYDEDTEEWQAPDSERKEVNYNLESMDLGAKIDTKTIPSEIFWGEDDSIEMFVNGIGEADENMLKISESGFPAILEFDVSDVPMFETGVFTLTWEDDNNKSNRGGELITSTRPVIRVSENEFIYPQETDYSHHSMNDAYINNIESDDSNFTGNITRVSNYGFYSEKQDNFYSGEHDVNAGSTDYPEYLDTPIQFPWSVNYTISESERDNAESVGSNELYGEGMGYRSVYNFMNNDEIMNHEIIKDVASELGDVCETMNATHPTEQLRVVADFVQYLSHYSSLASVDEPEGLVSVTSHPVVTLTTGEGDCKDFTLLGNAILQQEPFNMNPDAFVIENVSTENGESISHVSTSVPVSELDGEEFVQKLDDKYGSSGTTVGIAQNSGEKHIYVEMSGPNNIGFVHSGWLEDEELEPIDSMV